MSNTENAADAVPVPHRLDAIESVLMKITNFLDKVGPILGAIVPGAGPVISVVDGVGHVAEDVINAVEGKPLTVDPAALAAGQLGVSTGNASLDQRLAEIESVMLAAVPVLAYVARQFGIEFAPAKPAPMSLPSVTGDTMQGQVESLVGAG